MLLSWTSQVHPKPEGARPMEKVLDEGQDWMFRKLVLGRTDRDLCIVHFSMCQEENHASIVPERKSAHSRRTSQRNSQHHFEKIDMSSFQAPKAPNQSWNWLKVKKSGRKLVSLYLQGQELHGLAKRGESLSGGDRWRSVEMGLPLGVVTSPLKFLQKKRLL